MPSGLRYPVSVVLITRCLCLPQGYKLLALPSKLASRQLSSYAQLRGFGLSRTHQTGASAPRPTSPAGLGTAGAQQVRLGTGALRQPAD